jgi:hypothetical protein
MSQIDNTVMPTGNYRHEALFYSGEADLLDRTEPFIRGAVENDEPVLVAISRTKIERLRALIGRMEDKVRFVDMAEVGSDPVRIIPCGGSSWMSTPIRGPLAGDRRADLGGTQP